MFKENQISFLKNFIACKSITPEDDGAIDTLISALDKKFKVHKLVFQDNEEVVTNLYAEIGSGPKNLCFAGHTDVVPPGKWSSNPFNLRIIEGIAFGRGMVDMKGAIFSFICALNSFLSENQDASKYKISFLISGNEEGNPKNGMVKLIEWINEQKIKIDDCLIGEPTSKDKLGDTIKIGRRGSITFHLTILGSQGHVAYPENANNPIPILNNIVSHLVDLELDKGNEYFQPSNLEITDISSNNPTSNVIPGKISTIFNIRYNDIKKGNEIEKIVRDIIELHTQEYKMEVSNSGDAFIKKGSPLSKIAAHSIKKILSDVEPTLSTSGGTSDARLLKDICSTAELGLLNKTAHKIDESCSMTDLFNLSKIYRDILDNYFLYGMAR